MKKKLIFNQKERVLKYAFAIAITLLTNILMYGQEPSAILNLESTTEGFLPPRMSTTNRDAITTPADGMLIFNSSTGYINYYDIFSGWLELRPPSTPAPQVTATQTITINSAGFKPSRSTDGFYSGFGQGGCRITSPTTSGARLNAVLDIPVGSTITNVTFYYKDNDPSAEMSFDLDSEVLNQGFFSDIYEYDTGVSTANNTWTSHTASVNHVVASERGYRIDVYSTSWGGDMWVKGASVTYTLPTN